MNTRPEPLLTPAAIVAGVGAGIALFVAFGLDLTPEQTAAVMGFATFLAPFLVAFVARRKVTPLADPRDDDDTPLVRAGTE